jgi:hypothetical protein|eukprot:COSAG02_NODE_6885_length_3309_cov_1.979439_2_plen_75_part_00
MKMFVSSIGALNAANRQQPWQHVPRKWPGKEDKQEEPKMDETLGPGVRRAAEPKIGKSKDVDPLAELRKEILGE